MALGSLSRLALGQGLEVRCRADCVDRYPDKLVSFGQELQLARGDLVESYSFCCQFLLYDFDRALPDQSDDQVWVVD